MYSSPSVARSDLAAVAVEHERLQCAQANPIGYGVSALVGNRGRDARERADVRFGRTVEVVVDRRGPERWTLAQVLDRKHLARKQHEPEARAIVRSRGRRTARASVRIDGVEYHTVSRLRRNEPRELLAGSCRGPPRSGTASAPCLRGT